MTTITIDRATVEQALEALEMAKINGRAGLLPTEIEEIADAITALRAALARQAEPVQEPAAKVELMMTGGNAGLATRIVEIDHHLRDRLRPGQLLYTAPPKRQPLTDEQISDLWCEVSNTDFVTADTHVFARAVESKLQEKNT
jgi:hypothetical protein